MKMFYQRLFEDSIMETRSEIQLLTAKKLGTLLSLSKRQIFRLNSCGKLPAPIRIGGSVRWAESTIAKWLAVGAPDRRTFEAMQGDEMT
jgi:predicted DNA-binding transcriptional regulator AlpA